MPADTAARAEATPHRWGSPREGWSDDPSSIPTRRTRTAARPQRTADGGRSPRQTEPGSKTEGRPRDDTAPPDAAMRKRTAGEGGPPTTRDPRRNAGAREQADPHPDPDRGAHRLRARRGTQSTCASGGPRPARALPSPASCSSPTGPALRANPCPEVTDPICRLPLPTLLHRLEAVNLRDLLRIWVRPGTRFTSLRRIFKGRRERTGHRKSRGALREPRFPISGRTDSRDWVPYKEKRTLPGALADVSDFVCVTAHDPRGPISVSRFGNIDRTPFRWNTGNDVLFSAFLFLRFRSRHCPVSERSSPIS